MIAQEIYKLYHTSEVTLVRNVPGYKVVQKGDRLRQFLGVSPEIRIALYQGQLESDRQLDTLILCSPIPGSGYRDCNDGQRAERNTSSA